jgi:hypothetical protein
MSDRTRAQSRQRGKRLVNLGRGRPEAGILRWVAAATAKTRKARQICRTDPS